MKKYSRKLAALAAAASLALTGTLAGCSSSGSDHKIRIGIKFDQPGLGYQDGSPALPRTRLSSSNPPAPTVRTCSITARST